MLTGTLPPLSASQRPWIEQVIVEDDNGNPLDLTGCDIDVRLSGCGCHDMRARIDVLGFSLFQFTFDGLRNLSSGYHDLSCDITRGGVTNPLFRFTVPVTSECSR